MFEPERLYLTDHEELTAVWSASTLANCVGKVAGRPTARPASASFTAGAT